MGPDKYQQAWQAQSARTQVTIDADLLLKEVQRNQQHFRAIVFRRDVVEVGVAFVMLPLWIILGIALSLPWTWYLTMPALAWIAGFMLWYRLQHPQRPNSPDDSLLQCVQNSLTHVDNQIWLLRNVFWWYLLPPTISILTFFAHVTLRVSQSWIEAFCAGGFFFAFLVGIYAFVDYINQRAVSLDLEPRRRELLELLAQLGVEAMDESAATGETCKAEILSVFKRWFIVAIVCSVILVIIVLARRSTDITRFTGDRRGQAESPLRTIWITKSKTGSCSFTILCLLPSPDSFFEAGSLLIA